MTSTSYNANGNHHIVIKSGIGTVTQFLTVRMNERAHNANVPARGVRAVRYVLCLYGVPVKRLEVNLERRYEWISRW